MLQKLVDHNRTDWDVQLHTVLFAYRTAYKVVTGHSPFQLVYGLTPLMPTEYVIPTLRTPGDPDFTPRRVLTTRLTDLEKLDETRHSAAIHQGVKQWNRAQWAQTQGPKLQYNDGDHVLWHPKSANLHAGKLRGKWFGPYRVQYVLPNNIVL